MQALLFFLQFTLQQKLLCSSSLFTLERIGILSMHNGNNTTELTKEVHEFAHDKAKPLS